MKITFDDESLACKQEFLDVKDAVLAIAHTGVEFIESFESMRKEGDVARKIIDNLHLPPEKHNVTLDKLKLLASIAINNYVIGATMSDAVFPDTSLIERQLVTDLKHAGVEPDDIEKVIVDMDWSSYITKNEVGERERSFVMDSIKEIYDDIPCDTFIIAMERSMARHNLSLYIKDWPEVLREPMQRVIDEKTEACGPFDSAVVNLLKVYSRADKFDNDTFENETAFKDFCFDLIEIHEKYIGGTL